MTLAQLTTLLDDSDDATVAVDLRGDITEWNPAAEKMFGWMREEILHAPLRQLVPGDALAEFNRIWNRLSAGDTLASFDTHRLHRDGRRIPVVVHVIAVRDDTGFAGAVATIRPQDHAATTGHDARDDEASGLVRRQALQAALAAPVPAGLARAVAVLDVDAFALVNQSYGPDAGDAVLRELGSRLATTAAGAVVGRWQADEFVYVVDAPNAAAALEGIITAAQRAVREPLQVDDQWLYLSVSAGLASSPLTAPCELFAAATRGLRVAKSGGRDRAVWCDAAHRPVPGNTLRLASDLRRGIDAGEMRLLYQPILELNNHDIVGVEALVRWQRPGVGLLAPVDFIDVAERTGQIVPLGAWVTAQACLTAVRLAQLGSAPHSMSINISARQLSDPGVVSMLEAALADSGCSPSTIVIEVTETALMHDLRSATATLQAMKALGVSLALDDFGTGYSSLLYLKRFPVDRIKIDQSFIRGLGVDTDDTAIVASTISLAHSVGVQAVAEGVETFDQLSLLRQMGCDFAQGHLFSRALTLGQLEQWLRQHLPARRRRAAAGTTPLPPEASHILRLHREGASLHSVAAALNLEGKRTSTGMRWSPKSVAQVIATCQFPAIALPREPSGEPVSNTAELLRS